MPNGDELTHYGVKGMHWGIRRYQPYPDGKNGNFIGKHAAKKAQRTMNQNSYTYATANHYLKRSAKRAAKFMIKAEKANNEGKINKRNRLSDKAHKELKDMEFHKNTMNKAASAIEKTIKKLDAGGWSTQSKEYKGKIIAAGRRKFMDAMFVPHLDRARLLGIASIAAPTGPVTSYKVKENPRFGIDNTGSPYPQNKAAIKLNKAVQKRGGNSITSINAKSNKGVVAAVTADQAKRMGLNNSTRITGKEESDMWKAIGRQLEKEQKKKRR